MISWFSFYMEKELLTIENVSICDMNSIYYNF